MTNKIWDWDEDLAKARVQEVRSQMTIDNIANQVKGWLDKIVPENSIDLSKKSSEEIKKLFQEIESGSSEEKILILAIINNPKTTPEDLDYYFDNIQEWSDVEFLVAKALIAHPDLSQELFDKNYGMAMQKWSEIFELFEQADKERANRKILNGIIIPLHTNSENIFIAIEDMTNIVWLYASEDYVPTVDDKCWLSGNSFLLTLSKWDWRKGMTVYLKDKTWNVITRNYIVILKTDDKKETKEAQEKMNETLQGSIFTLFNKSGSWIIRWDNGKDYIFDFAHINDKNRDEDRAWIYNELSIGSKVEFKLLPRKWKKKEYTYFDPDFMATDIVVKN